jgi:hypothetical protein
VLRRRPHQAVGAGAGGPPRLTRQRDWGEAEVAAPSWQQKQRARLRWPGRSRIGPPPEAGLGLDRTGPVPPGPGRLSWAGRAGDRGPAGDGCLPRGARRRGRYGGMWTQIAFKLRVCRAGRAGRS